jgi:hypothetical protein
MKNDTNQEISFALDVQGPNDWTVTATPSGQAQRRPSSSLPVRPVTSR